MPLIILKEGDLFQQPVQALVNTVNCFGAMGAGLALQFKNRFPENFRFYRSVCNRGELRPGDILVMSLNGMNPAYKRTYPTVDFIVNLATKDHWNKPSELVWIQNGAARLAQWATQNHVQSIACPALGAGLGQLDWSSVHAIMADIFDQHETLVYLFEPQKQAAPKGRQVRRSFPRT